MATIKSKWWGCHLTGVFPNDLASVPLMYMGIEEAIQERVRVHRDLPSPSIRICVRVERGLSRQELGEILGVSRQTIGRWERGERTPRGSLLAAYVKALRVLQESP